ncbi:hypothetical protein C8T65DRAFT_156538 [Cerioporus squamosus]|nr:hypothetical protein C8T65DRAFT_156538 [Cerioporus squamosus]
MAWRGGEVGEWRLWTSANAYLLTALIMSIIAGDVSMSILIVRALARRTMARITGVRPALATARNDDRQDVIDSTGQGRFWIPECSGYRPSGANLYKQGTERRTVSPSAILVCESGETQKQERRCVLRYTNTGRPCASKFDQRSAADPGFCSCVQPAAVSTRKYMRGRGHASRSLELWRTSSSLRRPPQPRPLLGGTMHASCSVAFKVRVGHWAVPRKCGTDGNEIEGGGGRRRAPPRPHGRCQPPGNWNLVDNLAADWRRNSRQANSEFIPYITWKS